MKVNKVLLATALFFASALAMPAQESPITVSLLTHVQSSDAVATEVLKEVASDLKAAGVNVEVAPNTTPGLLLEIESVAVNDKLDVIVVDMSYRVEGIDVPFHISLATGKASSENADGIAGMITKFAHAAYDSARSAGLDKLGGAKT